MYGQRIGVTHAVTGEAVEFTAVAKTPDVAEGAILRVRTDDLDPLLARQGGRVYALAHACAHLGGPLSEGTLENGLVICPWHASQFALENGRVINGPATQNQRCFDVREREGVIEVRAAR